MRWWIALIPFVFGLAATVLAVVLGDRRILISQTEAAWLWMIGGMIVSATILVVLLFRLVVGRARAAGSEAGAQQQKQNQARLLTRLDHELKNPITAILAGVSNLDASMAAVLSIQSQAGRLSRLLTDLRKLSELRSLELELELAPVDVAALCDEVQQAVGELPDAAERSITLGFPRAPRPLPLVKGDSDLLFLAFYNLLANAVKYSVAGDAIDVRGRESNNRVIVEIADTGVGIPLSDQSQVWEELSRGRNALAIPGSGLGLPFVRAIIERHGGTVELTSREGEGTAVLVSLPGAS